MWIGRKETELVLPDTKIACNTIRCFDMAGIDMASGENLSLLHSQGHWTSIRVVCLTYADIMREGAQRIEAGIPKIEKDLRIYRFLYADQCDQRPTGYA